MPYKQYSAAAERNQQAILDRLRQLLIPHGNALEVASGTGQHLAWFAAGLPDWQWQPSDATDQDFESIKAWCAGLGNARAPLRLNVLGWEGAGFKESFDLIFCANMLHIAPWPCCAALMQGAARQLAPQGLLISYGPYLEIGTPTAPSNLAFDHDLRRRDPLWGIRRLEDVAEVAQAAGLRLASRYNMPANNLLLVWERIAC